MVCKYQFDWKINDYSKFNKNEKMIRRIRSIRSPFFIASPNETIHQWQLTFRLHSFKKQKYSLSLELMNENEQNNPVSVNFRIELADFRNVVFFPGDDDDEDNSDDDGNSDDNDSVFCNFNTENSVWVLSSAITYDKLFMSSKKFTEPITFTCYMEFNEPRTHDSNVQTKYQSASFGSNFFEIFQHQEHTDVVIKCQSKEFKAHKLILRCASQVFNELFKAEEYVSSSNTELIIDNVSSEIFEDFLKYCYTGDVSMNYNNAKALLEVGKTYQVDNLQYLCFTEIEKNLNESNDVEILLIADKHERVKLKKMVIKFIKRNLAAILKTSAWKENMLQRGDLTNEILVLFTS